jgi:hypothetical protein
LLVRDSKGKNAARLVTRTDPGVVSLVAELRGHERPGAEELGQWKTHHEERKTIDASQAAITLSRVFTVPQLEEFREKALELEKLAKEAASRQYRLRPPREVAGGRHPGRGHLPGEAPGRRGLPPQLRRAGLGRAGAGHQIHPRSARRRGVPAPAGHDRGLINIPPGFAKSMIGAVFMPAWVWIKEPIHLGGVQGPELSAIACPSDAVYATLKNGRHTGRRDRLTGGNDPGIGHAPAGLFQSLGGAAYRRCCQEHKSIRHWHLRIPANPRIYSIANYGFVNRDGGAALDSAWKLA